VLAQLTVPFRDTAAADLLVAVHPGADAPHGLEALAATSGGFTLELRVLGASHAVVAHGPDGRVLSEVVAGWPRGSGTASPRPSGTATSPGRHSSCAPSPSGPARSWPPSPAPPTR
jgi:hypothetical protein